MQQVKAHQVVVVDLPIALRAILERKDFFLKKLLREHKMEKLYERVPVVD